MFLDIKKAGNEANFHFCCCENNEDKRKPFFLFVRSFGVPFFPRSAQSFFYLPRNNKFMENFFLAKDTRKVSSLLCKCTRVLSNWSEKNDFSRRLKQKNRLALNKCLFGFSLLLIYWNVLNTTNIRKETKKWSIFGRIFLSWIVITMLSS